MGSPVNLMNIYTIPTWGLVAFGVAVAGALVAVLVRLLTKKPPVWTLALVPLAAVAAYAAASSQENMVTLAVVLLSLAAGLVLLLLGTFGLASGHGPQEPDAQG